MTLGPGQIPPQAQKAFVRELFRPRRGGPLVACVLVDEHPGKTELEFTNEGGDTAVDLRYVIAERGGTAKGSLGHLPPAASATASIAPVPAGPVRCVWLYSDRKGRLHVWSYDGRHKRLGRRRQPSDDECFRLMGA